MTPGRAPSKSNFVNIGKYVEANQPGLGQFSNQLASGVQGAVDTASGELSGINQEYQSKLSTPGDYSHIVDLIKSGNAKDLTPEEKQKAKTYVQGPGYGGYGDITQVGGYEQMTKDRQKALDLLGMSKEGASGGLIKEVAKPTQYTKGLESFDLSMLNSEPGARSTLTGIAEKNKGFEGALGTAADQAKASIGATKGQFEGGKSQISSAANEALNSLSGLRITNDAQVKKAQEEAYKKYKEDAYKQAGDYTQSKYGQDLYHSGVDIGDYLSAKSPSDFYVKSALTPEQESSYQVLNDILGTSPDLMVEGGGRELHPFNMGGFQSAVDALHGPGVDTSRGTLLPQLTGEYSLPGDAQKTKDTLDFIKKQQDDIQEYGPFTGRPLVDDYYKYKLAKNKLGM